MSTALVNHGLILHKMGRATEALQSLDRALAAGQPDTVPDSHYRRGATLAELGRAWAKHWAPATRLR